MSVQTEDWLPRHRLTVDEYYRMAETGVLAQDARVELINGEIIDMAPPGSRHSAIVSFLNHAFASAIAGMPAMLSVQSPLRLSRSSEPQPDLMLLHPRDDYYAAGHPGPADALLVVEVSDSSVRYDRQIKLPLYARHGVAEFWLIDLKAKELLICRKPHAEGYHQVTIRGSNDAKNVETLQGVVVDLQRLFSL